MNQKYKPVRVYTLAITDGCSDQEEHSSEEARDQFLGVQSSLETDWYCIDVNEDFTADVYLVDVPGGEEDEV